MSAPDPRFITPLLAFASRRLPPEEWCDRVTELAADHGYTVTWHFDPGEPSELHPGGVAGTARAWAKVATGRGSFDVRPARDQSWQTAIETALGITFPNAFP